MKFEDLVNAQELAASLQAIWSLQEDIDNKFSGKSEVTLAFSEGNDSLDFDGIEMYYVIGMLDNIEDDLKTRLRLLGVWFKDDIPKTTQIKETSL